ncbi:MAG: hypothetical protein ABR981_01610 [Candidatus Micrarchaeaceae archaeon]
MGEKLDKETKTRKKSNKMRSDGITQNDDGKYQCQFCNRETNSSVEAMVHLLDHDTVNYDAAEFLEDYELGQKPEYQKRKRQMRDI